MRATANDDRGSPSLHERSTDLSATTMEEAAMVVTCAQCSGRRRKQCSHCFGRGHVDSRNADWEVEVLPCATCGGRREVNCSGCNGRGQVWSPDAPPPEPLPNPTDDVLVGRWSCPSDGSQWAISANGDAGYLVVVNGPKGVSRGDARRQGETVTMEIGVLIMKVRYDFQLAGDELRGSGRLFGLPVPLVLQRQ
jgi:hypothetical protein